MLLKYQRDIERANKELKVAEAIATELVPRADVLTPNAWELDRLSGLPVSDPISAVQAEILSARGAWIVRA